MGWEVRPLFTVFIACNYWGYIAAELVHLKANRIAQIQLLFCVFVWCVYACFGLQSKPPCFIFLRFVCYCWELRSIVKLWVKCAEGHWWCHVMETHSALLTSCEKKPQMIQCYWPFMRGIYYKGPVIQTVYVFLDVTTVGENNVFLSHVTRPLVWTSCWTNGSVSSGLGHHDEHVISL